MININNYFKRRILHYIVLIIFLLFTYFVLSSTFSVNSIFEGTLTVSQLRFTYGGGKKFVNDNNGRKIKTKRLEQAFLRKVLPLEKTIILGVESFTLPPGRYQSDSQSFLNLNLLEPLKIEFKNNQTRLTIEPFDKTTSQLAVSELRFEPETNITNLAYDSHNNQLYISLKQAQNVSSGFLSLDLGIQELQIEIDGEYSLPKLANTGKKLNFRLKPSLTQLKNIPLQEDVQLEFDLSEYNKNYPKIEFGQRFRVRNVQLYTRTGDVKDATSISSIIEGQIQMPQTEKKLNLQSGQFLLSEASDISNPEKSIPDESICIENAQPNIYMIRNIEANSKGIGFRIIGESRKLQSGFDPCFPVDWIQVSWLGKLFNQELHPALLTFFTGSATGLLVWIVSHIKEFLPNSNNN